MKKSVMISWLLVVVSFLLFIPGCVKEEGSPEFFGTPLSGDAPLTVDFTSQDNADSDMWWFFGDGQSSTENNPSHTYTREGFYTVSLVRIRNGEWSTETKDNYVIVGEPAPGLSLRVQGDSIYNVDIPPGGNFTVIDLAGEGVLYWTCFRAADKAENDSGVTMAYEHSIWADRQEVYGDVDQGLEIWNFQQQEVRRPDAYYPAINALDDNTMAIAFWRINVPFHDSLVFMPENNHAEGTVWVKMASITYGLKVSGEDYQDGVQRGHQWTILGVKDSVGFPAATVIKTALEREFAERVYSVAIVNYREEYGAAELNKLLSVDAPRITRDEIRNFLEQEYIDFFQYE